MPCRQSTYGSTRLSMVSSQLSTADTMPSAIHRCATWRLSAASAASFLKIVVRERVMGVNTDYLGHVEIVPNLNQAEYDYLHALARSRRSYRSGGPNAVIPEDPHDGK